MKRSAFIVLLIAALFAALGFQFAPSEDSNQESFTIYLVRHAEKDESPNAGANPALTSCGKERAEHLMEFLKEIELQAVYSTDYIRTMHTAQPTATEKGIAIETYNGGELEAFAKLLMDKKQDALVVGHSNTTDVLAGLLVGERGESFDLGIYNRIYQVVVHADESQLNLFHSAYSCKDHQD